MTSLLSESGIEPSEESVRRFGHGAGGLMVAVAIASVPAGLLATRTSAVTVLLLAAIAAGSGAICLSVRWSELSRGAIVLAPALVSVQAGLWTWLVDPIFGVHAVLVAGLAGYAFTKRRIAAAHAAFACAAILVPAVLEPAAASAILEAGALFCALAAIAAGAAALIRRELDSRARAYRRFAGEALELAVRIRSSEFDPANEPAPRARAGSNRFVPVNTPRERVPRWRGSALAGAALAAFALPLAAIASIGSESPPVIPVDSASEAVGDELAAAGDEVKRKNDSDARDLASPAKRANAAKANRRRTRAYARGRQGIGDLDLIAKARNDGSSAAPALDGGLVAAAPSAPASDSPDSGSSSSSGSTPTPTRGREGLNALLPDELITPVKEIESALDELAGGLKALDPRR